MKNLKKYSKKEKALYLLLGSTSVIGIHSNSRRDIYLKLANRRNKKISDFQKIGKDIFVAIQKQQNTPEYVKAEKELASSTAQ